MVYQAASKYNLMTSIWSISLVRVNFIACFNASLGYVTF
jgi:hypothetical protein